ncbi:MAG: hypothetical protein ACHQK8_07515 [Bacteroidia bacterium]
MTELPEEFTNEIRSLLGAECGSFFSAFENKPATSIRLNGFKPVPLFGECEKVEWCHDGRYLHDRPGFIGDPLFHAGTYYVQESSSMFLDFLLRNIISRNDKPLKILDLCAAPGGKSTIISSCLSEKDLLVSNEIIRSRVSVLAENMMKWGQSNGMITNNDAKDFSHLDCWFDVIVLDAPCSGEGLFRKDKKAIEQWSAANVLHCAARQKRIFSDVIGSLKPNGYLIYSTCTFNEIENEENVKWMMEHFEMEPMQINTDAKWNIVQNELGYRFYPHKVKGEGFFISCLKKRSGNISKTKSKSSKPEFVSKKTTEELKPWLKNPDQYEFIQYGKEIQALNKDLINDFEFVSKKIKTIYSGITMGELMNGKLHPSHQLALSNVLDESVKRLDLSREDAIRYLRMDPLKTETPEKGLHLVTYKNFGLGWVNVLPTRINNYLPNNLRIRKMIS